MSTDSSTLPSGPHGRVSSSPLKRTVSALVVGMAAGAGWAYSSVYGCDTCAIQSSQPAMAAFGGLIGLNLLPLIGRKKT